MSAEVPNDERQEQKPNKSAYASKLGCGAKHLVLATLPKANKQYRTNLQRPEGPHNSKVCKDFWKLEKGT